MFEIWRVEGRSRVLVARFRMRSDAVRYLDAMGAGEPLELVEPKPSRSTIPPASVRRRRRGVVFASEHPDEFIADQAEADAEASGDDG